MVLQARAGIGELWACYLLCFLVIGVHCGDDCWEGSFNLEMCCSPGWGTEGHWKCWNEPRYTYDRCCVFHPGSGNEQYLPLMGFDEIPVASSHTADGKGVLRIRQNISEAPWDHLIPGLLFKMSYGMLRWFETLPDAEFRHKRVLELGAGVGLLSLHLALRGAVVTATDASARALATSRSNAQENLGTSEEGQDAFWNRLTWRLVQWQRAQSPAEVTALGLAPPYDLVVCSALLYVPTRVLATLVRLLWLVTDRSSVILWGSGIVGKEQAAERWALLEQCFEATEVTDAVAAGYTVIPGTAVVRLRRRRDMSALAPLARGPGSEESDTGGRALCRA